MIDIIRESLTNAAIGTVGATAAFMLVAFLRRMQKLCMDPLTMPFQRMWFDGDPADPIGMPGCLDYSRCLGDLPQGEPCVVFCRFTADVQAVHRAAAKLGLYSMELSGQRNDLEAWQRGAASVLAVQIQAGSLGIELHRAAFAAFYSLGYSLSEYLQARARLVRPEQTRPVHFTHLVVSGTVDPEVYRALERREQVIEAVLRTRSAEL